ncbi:Putative deoxyribonuclease RhsC [Mixta theicola]|nr:RHS repeat-associated core domain-containing protein [Mixta theicola]QHM77344.1 Putative deoxyribonuclease RhsC [Mixta theicola]
MPHSTCHTDPQLGVDVHTYLIPPSPTPVPLPTPRIAAVFDPFDYIPIIGSTVTINWLRRGTAGTGGMGIHIPVGGSWIPVAEMTAGPQITDEIFMGSKTVIADGDPMSRFSEPVLDCNIVGLVPPFRLKKATKPKPLSLELPLALNLALPNGVEVGGPSTINLVAMAMKAGLWGLKKLIRSGPAKALRKKILPNMNCENSWICRWVFGDPVDVRDGSVLIEHQDFELPGRLPLEWTRYYRSSLSPVTLLAPSCGEGWQTPADIQLSYDAQLDALFFHEALTLTVFPGFPAAPGREHAVMELVDGAVVWQIAETDNNQLVVETKEGKRYYFRYPATQPLPQKPMLLEAISDLVGNRWQFVRRNGELQQLVEWDAAGQRRRTLQAQWQNHRLTALTFSDEDSQCNLPLTRYHYDDRGQLVAEEDAVGLCRRYGWQQGKMISHSLRSGLTFHYQYDEQQRVCHSWGDDGLYDYRFVYHDLLNEVEITDSLGNRTQIQFDADRLPICEINPEGSATRYRYDEVGRPVSQVDAARRETRFEWDDAGNLCTLTHPDRSRRLYVWLDNRLIKETDEEGASRLYEWSRDGQLISQTDELGQIAIYRYNDFGDLIFSMDPAGCETQLEYDGYGFLRSHTDGEGARTTFRYDSRGLLRQRTDAMGRHCSWDYDAKGRLIRWQSEDGSVQTLGWDACDNPSRHVDELNGETRLSYSGMGVLTSRTTPDGKTVRCEYDSEEQLTAVVNELGQRYRLRRDGAGRIIQTEDYYGQQTRYRYDEAGNLVARSDALGQLTEYRHDRMGRLTEKRYRDGEQTLKERFRYDRCGRVTALLNPWREVTRKYDAAGRLTEERQDGLGIYWRYDAAGNCISRHSDAGHRTEWRYNQRGQPVAVTLDGETSRFAYDACGRLQDETLGETLSRRYRYDARDRLVSQAVSRNDAGLFSTGYRYDRNGNPEERSDSRLGHEYFSYDPVGRLLAHTCPEGRVTRFIQDAAGNQLLTQIRAQDDTPQGWWREGELHGVRYLFDRAGNLRRQSDRDGNHRQLRWDGNQRLRGSRDKHHTTEYGYDAAGRRVFKRNAQETTWFWWDGDALLGEVTRPNSTPGLPDTAAADPDDAKASAQRRLAARALWPAMQEYVYRPGSFIPFALLPDRTQTDARIHYYHNDLNGCPLRLTDGDGNITWEAHYHAWGGVKRLTQQVHNPLRFQGQYYDKETGLHYNRYRYYNPHSGSFISQDPIGLLGGVNVYQYAPNPISWIDPLGLSCSSDAKALRENMVAAGKAEPNFKNAAHHIVMSNSTDSRMVALRDKMKKLGININTAENGIFLPSNSKVPLPAGNTLPNHAGIHTNAYKQKVFDRLNPINNTGDFLNELDKIYTEIADGIF